MAANGSPNGGTRQERLALLLAGGRSVRSAAPEVGVPLRTAYRWSKDDEFRQQVRTLRAEMVRQAGGVLADGMVAAGAKLRLLVNSADERVALAAARSVLEFGQKAAELGEIEERVGELERIARGAQKASSP